MREIKYKSYKSKLHMTRNFVSKYDKNNYDLTKNKKINYTLINLHKMSISSVMEWLMHVMSNELV